MGASRGAERASESAKWSGLNISISTLENAQDRYGPTGRETATTAFNRS